MRIAPPPSKERPFAITKPTSVVVSIPDTLKNWSGQLDHFIHEKEIHLFGLVSHYICIHEIFVSNEPLFFHPFVVVYY